VEVLQDHLLVPSGYRLPLSAKGTGVSGMRAEKISCRLSRAKRSADHALDTAESGLTFGKPALKITLMSTLFVERNCFEEAEAANYAVHGFPLFMDIFTADNYHTLSMWFFLHLSVALRER
jgi:hypothetical protein